MTVPEFIPPKLTGEAQRAAEYIADRADIYRTARALLGSFEWAGESDEPYPDDVLALARFLSGDATE